VHRFTGTRYWPILACGTRVRLKTRYFEIFKINISNWPYSNEILYTKALEYKEYFTQIDLWGIPKSSRDIQDFFDMKYTMFGQAVSKIYDCFDFCNVMTAFDPRWKYFL
jgi:hypothetical protein